MVVGEVARSVTLLIGAGLLVRSFWRLQQVNPGFDGSGLLTMRLSLPLLQYRTGEMKWAFYDRLLANVRALPGVQDAGTSSIVPLGGDNTSTPPTSRLFPTCWRSPRFSDARLPRTVPVGVPVSFLARLARNSSVPSD